jgi:ABC-type polysaccharide/polyol phosphate export permease
MFFHKLKLAVHDLNTGLKHYPVWLYLAWQDIKQRYRRSVIGPFWITITTGIMVLAMGPLYGSLLKQEIGPYIQYLSVSIIIWTFISGYINESCNAFIAADGFIKQIKLPITLHLLRVLAKNVLYLLHNAIVIFIVLFFFPPEHFKSILIVPISIALVIANLYWMGLVLAVFCTRFRDIPQIVTSIMQVLFFLSPIIWRVDMLGTKRWAADANPFYHFMELIREPILGGQIQPLSWLFTLAMLVAGGLFTLLLFAKFRARIPYWL